MKIQLFLLFAFLLLISVFLSAQTLEPQWEKELKNSSSDNFTDVIEDQKSGFMVLGSTCINGNKNHDYWLVHYSAGGDLLWTKTYGNGENQMPSKLTQTPTGNYIFTGKSVNAENKMEAIIVKTDNEGNKLWQKNFTGAGNCRFDGVIVPAEDNIIVAGTKCDDKNMEQIWLAALNENGEMVWEKIFGEGKKALSESLKLLPDGSFMLAGQVFGAGKNDADSWIFRFDKSGELLWDKIIGTPEKNEWPECVCCTPDNNIIVVGWSGTCMNDINSEDPIFDFDLALTKISPEGKVLWNQNIDSEGSEGGNAVVVRPDGKILLAGKKETSFLGRIGPWILLTDENGKVLSELVFPFRFGNDQAARIINSSDGGFVVIGPGQIDEATRTEGWIKKFKPL